jgi:hypothetical protein
LSGRWWPSPRGLTGFASAVLRALFDGFDGIVHARGGAAAISAGGGIKTDGIFFPLTNKHYVQRTKSKERHMEANASKHASKRVHACARARARARGLMAAPPGGGPAEDGSELRSHACGVAKVESRGRVPAASAASSIVWAVGSSGTSFSPPRGIRPRQRRGESTGRFRASEK